MRTAFGVAGVALLFVGYKFANPAPPPPQTKVPDGKTRICITGYSTVSPPSAKAHVIADEIAKADPQFETWYYWSNTGWSSFAQKRTADCVFPCELKGHSTSPFVYLEQAGTDSIVPIGGCDRFAKWAKDKFPNAEAVVKAADTPAAADVWHGWNRPQTAK